MKMLQFEEARRDFDRLFDLAAAGETVVIERQHQRVELRPALARTASEIAPAGHFAMDYSPEEIAELNALAAHAPQSLVP